MRKLSMALAGAVAMGGLALTSGTASAGTVHTETAIKCGTKFCAQVKGKKLHVDTVKVWDKRLKNGKPTVSGWAYVEVSAPKHKFYILYATKKFKNASWITLKINKSFPNNTLLCAGVSKTKTYVNHVGTACAKVHK